MGKVYKRKKRACGLCKPHKRGISPRDTEKQRAREKSDTEEMRMAEGTWVPGHYEEPRR